MHQKRQIIDGFNLAQNCMGIEGRTRICFQNHSLGMLLLYILPYLGQNALFWGHFQCVSKQWEMHF